jgi:RNA polymerase sigma factor (sigma-70 family)
MNQTDDLLPTRRTLLSRLRDWNDQESWRCFFDTYWKLIYSTAVKGGLTDAEAQDVVQDTVISVMKSIRTFRYDPQRGSFKSWLLKLTRWRILDQLDKRDPHLARHSNRADTSTRTATIERQPDPAGSALEAAWDREYEANLRQAAFERVKQKVDPKQYQVFDLYVVKKWPVVKVARFLGINAGVVYLTKHRITNLVKKEVAQMRDKPI